MDTTDAHGHVIRSFQEVTVRYEKDGKDVDYTVGRIQDTERENEFKQEIRSNGLTYYFNQNHYLFVPDEYEPSPEEQKAQEAGELFISTTGSGVREEQVVTGLTWYSVIVRSVLSNISSNF